MIEKNREEISEKGKDTSITGKDVFEVNSSGKNNENEVVVFEDPNFERYIRSYLGKSSEEEIMTNELAEITELVIDRRFVELELSVIGSHKMYTLLRMDLTDLKYFSNLTKLDIQNELGDFLYSLDSIGYCTKLTELSVRYNFISQHQYKQASEMNFFADIRGYKTLYTILDKLPHLKKLDLGYTLPDHILQEVQEKVPNAIIFNDQPYEDKSRYKDYNNLHTLIIELDSLAPDTAVINMLLEEGEDINEAIKKVASFKNLNILRIVTKDMDVMEVNLDPIADHSNLEELVISIGTNDLDEKRVVLKGKALETIPNLKYLTLKGLVVTDKEISTLIGLESLNISLSYIDGLSFLTSCTNLYQLKLVHISSTLEDEDNIMGSIKQGMEKQTKLLYLTTQMSGPILFNCPEVLEGMTELRDYMAYEGNYEPFYDKLNFTNCKKIKRIVLSSPSPPPLGTFDFSIFKGLTKLETLWVPYYISYINEDTLMELENLQFFRREMGFGVDIENEIVRTNNLSNVLIKLPRISAISFDFIRYLYNKDMKIVDNELDEISCKALYNAGIFEEVYGIKKFVGMMDE
jgi:hypothetical protein